MATGQKRTNHCSIDLNFLIKIITEFMNVSKRPYLAKLIKYSYIKARYIKLLLLFLLHKGFTSKGAIAYCNIRQHGSNSTALRVRFKGRRYYPPFIVLQYRRKCNNRLLFYAIV